MSRTPTQYVPPPMPSLPTPEEPLSDGVVALRLAAERDIPEVLIGYQDDPDLPRALGEDGPPTGAALGSRADRAQQSLAAGRALVFTILQEGADTCRGEVRLTDVDWEGRRARLTVWVAPGFRGRGYGSRAARLATRWLLTRCGLEAICRRPG